MDYESESYYGRSPGDCFNSIHPDGYNGYLDGSYNLFYKPSYRNFVPLFVEEVRMPAPAPAAPASKKAIKRFKRAQKKKQAREREQHVRANWRLGFS